MKAAAAGVGVAVTVVLLLAAALFGPGTSSALLFLSALAGAAVLAGALAPTRALALAASGTLALGAVLVSPLTDRVVVQPARTLETEKLFGLPVPFVQAELTLTPPRPVEARWDPWENPADLLPWRYLASSALAVGLALALSFGVQRARGSSARRRATGRL